MENRTNKIIKFNEEEKYFILKQAVYKGKSYYMTVRVTPDETDFTKEFAILQETEENGKLYFSRVNDTKILSVLLKYLNDSTEA